MLSMLLEILYLHLDFPLDAVWEANRNIGKFCNIDNILDFIIITVVANVTHSFSMQFLK